MKTPREILFQKHEAAAPKLDVLRREVLNTELHRAEAPVMASTDLMTRWLSLLRGLRGHFAAMSAVWLVVAFLRLNLGHADGQPVSVASREIPPPQIILAALRANRLQLMELIEPLETRVAETPEFIPTRPRSARHTEILFV